MNEPQIIAAFIALLGIGLGSGLAGFGYLWRAKSEDRKKCKIVLFNLLEIWNCIRISKIDSTQATKDYFEIVKKIHKKILNTELEEQPEALFDFVHSFIHKLISEKNHSAIGPLSESYKDCVKDLSEQSPLLAFRLNGREELNKTLEQLDEYNESFASHFKKDPTNFKMVSSLQQTVKVDVIDEILKDLGKDINSVSIRIGLITFFETLLHLRKLKNKSMKLESKDFESKMEEYFKIVLESSAEAITETSG